MVITVLLCNICASEVDFMKKITHFLRFLALVFFLFLAITVCFVFNKALDQQIAASHTETLNEVSNILEEQESDTSK